MNQEQATQIRDANRVKFSNQGYRAQAAGFQLSDNPYSAEHSPQAHWDWRAGYLDAFKDSH